MKQAYNQNNLRKIDFKSNLLFNEERQRQEVSFRTYNLEILYDHFDKGWTFKKIEEGFLVRAPEEWLVDLTDPYKVAFYGDIFENLAYFDFLTDLIRREEFSAFVEQTIKKYGLRNLDVVSLKGPILETEIRIAGSDKRISKLKEFLFYEAKARKNWKQYFQNSHIFLKDCRRIHLSKINIHEVPLEIQNFFYNLIEIYTPQDNFRKDTLLNKSYIPDLFKNAPKADVYVFIPWGCFRYMLSFVNSVNLSKVMFWEIHSDKNQMHRNKYRAKNLKGKKVLIIDNSYSGKTLTTMSYLVKKEGGIPIRLALFPKSKKSFINSEYVLVIDKVFESKTIDLKNKDWQREIYKKVLKCTN